MTRDAILGSYSDFKLVKTRSVVQVVIEVPLERAHEVTDLFGLPQPGAEVVVAMARLRVDSAGNPTTAEPEPLHKPTRLSTLAGILCNEGGFWTFLSENGHAASNAEEAAEQVRLICGAIASRRLLDSDRFAAAQFRDLKGQYEAWRRAA